MACWRSGHLYSPLKALWNHINRFWMMKEISFLTFFKFPEEILIPLQVISTGDTWWLHVQFIHAMLLFYGSISYVDLKFGLKFSILKWIGRNSKKSILGAFIPTGHFVPVGWSAWYAKPSKVVQVPHCWHWWLQYALSPHQQWASRKKLNLRAYGYDVCHRPLGRISNPSGEGGDTRQVEEMEDEEMEQRLTWQGGFAGKLVSPSLCLN